MKKLGTRLISAALAACMMTSVLPVSAFASEGTDEETGESAETETVLPYDEYVDIYQPGTYEMPKGIYTENIAIWDQAGTVTINVTGPISLDSEWTFLEIYKYEESDEPAEPLNLTINLNGYTISSTGSGVLITDKGVDEAATVTVKNGTFRGDGLSVFCAQGGTLNLENVAVEGEEKGTPGAVNAVVCEAGGTVHIDGGSYYGKSQNYYDSTLYNEGTMTVTNATVHSEGGNAVNNSGNGKVTLSGGEYKSTGKDAATLSNSGTTMTVSNATVDSEQSNAVYNKAGDVTLSGGEFTSAGAPTIYAEKDAATEIESGTYQRTAAGGWVVTNYGELTIDQKDGGSTLIENKAEANDAIASSGTLHFNGGTVSAPNHSAIVCNGGTAEINGGTIKDSEKGIAVQGTAADVVLKNAVFENNSSDIYLAADKSITVKDTFKDRATVKAENESYKIKGDPNANLVSQNEGSYWAYDENEKNYILKQPDEGMYFVDAVNATAAVDDTVLKANTPVRQNDAVILTAGEPEGNMEFDCWEVVRKDNGQEIMPVQDETDPLKATFIMPDSDVTVTATYRQPDGGDPDGGDTIGDGSDAGKVIAAVAIGTATAWGVYEAGTGIYRAVNMNGIPMPANRGELAVLLWEHAGRPEPESTALYADIGAADTTLQKAARWCTEQGLLSAEAGNSFKPDTYVFKLRVCTTWEQAKQKGLIQ